MKEAIQLKTYATKDIPDPAIESSKERVRSVAQELQRISRYNRLSRDTAGT